MKKFKKSLAITLAIVICSLSIFAVHFFAAGILDGYLYDLDDHGRAIIVGWDNSSDILYVPAYIGNFRVIEIGNSAFKNDDYIHTLDLSGATYCDAIGMYAFAGSSLEGSLVIPTSVTYIGASAFERCNGLTDLSFSSFGETVPAQCFQYCENLQNVVLTDYITSVDRYAFYNCPNLSSVTIPRSVSSINSTAFANDENLTIYCYYDSYAHRFAEEMGMEYVILDPENIPTEPPTEPETDEPTSEPETDAPTSGPVEVTYIVGDADGDSWITIIDATVIQRVLVELRDDPDGMIALRGSSDGEELNVMHATKIQRYLADFVVAEPIGEEVTVLFAGVTTV